MPSLDSIERQLMDLARSHAETCSDDVHSKVGCIIAKNGNILAMGANRIPDGLKVLPNRLQRPTKYDWIEHAERVTIYSAAKRGVKLDGASMFLPWFPCLDCTRAIISVGITKLYAEVPDREALQTEDSWGFATALAMLEEARVTLVDVRRQEAS